jgi:hypothetical protein
MQDPDSFVVKVYWQQGGTVVGTIQEVRTGRTIPYRTKDELWSALRGSPSSSVDVKPPRQRQTSSTETKNPSNPNQPSGSRENENTD